MKGLIGPKVERARGYLCPGMFIMTTNHKHTKKQSANDKKNSRSIQLERRRNKPSGGQEKKAQNLERNKHRMRRNKKMMQMITIMFTAGKVEDGQEEQWC